ncbi:MAG: ChbG/HpnK family deacetylase [Cetobacterium sp.]
MKKRIIINVDDFGLSPGVNEGIIENYLNGILTSTTLTKRPDKTSSSVRERMNQGNLFSFQCLVIFLSNLLKFPLQPM